MVQFQVAYNKPVCNYSGVSDLRIKIVKYFISCLLCGDFVHKCKMMERLSAENMMDYRNDRWFTFL